MRDPDRIKRILAKLQTTWEMVPDWRLGQLISNLQGTGPQDVFFAEDDEWEERMDIFPKQRGGGGGMGHVKKEGDVEWKYVKIRNRPPPPHRFQRPEDVF